MSDLIHTKQNTHHCFDQTFYQGSNVEMKDKLVVHLTFDDREGFYVI